MLVYLGNMRTISLREASSCMNASCYCLHAACTAHTDCSPSQYCRRHADDVADVSCRSRAECFSRRDAVDGECPPGGCGVGVCLPVPALILTSSRTRYGCVSTACSNHTDCTSHEYCAKRSSTKQHSNFLCDLSYYCFENDDAVDGRCPEGTILCRFVPRLSMEHASTCYLLCCSLLRALGLPSDALLLRPKYYRGQAIRAVHSAALLLLL